MKGFQNFVKWIDDNWTSILVIIGVLIGLYHRAQKYIGKTNKQKIEIAKQEISQAILKLISQAEIDYADWKDSGKIKRSQVIHEIFMEYPILSKVTDQEHLITWIDEQIDNALHELRSVIKKNTGETSLANVMKDDHYE